MGSLFRWSMRNGAAILFAVALVQLLATLAFPVSVLFGETQRMASNHGYTTTGDWMATLQISQAFFGLGSAALTFIAALLVDRADRWLGRNERLETQQ